MKTNRWHGLKVGKQNHRNEYDERRLPDGTKLGKGDLLGQFNMGSTVVLVFEAPTQFRYDHFHYVVRSKKKNSKNGQEKPHKFEYELKLAKMFTLCARFLVLNIQ